jgi:hypothetical protein
MKLSIKKIIIFFVVLIPMLFVSAVVYVLFPRPMECKVWHRLMGESKVYDLKIYYGKRLVFTCPELKYKTESFKFYCRGEAGTYLIYKTESGKEKKARIGVYLDNGTHGKLYIQIQKNKVYCFDETRYFPFHNYLQAIWSSEYETKKQAPPEQNQS